MKKDEDSCVVCKKTFATSDLVPFSAVRNIISEMIKRDFSEWSDGCYICKSDITSAPPDRYSVSTPQQQVSLGIERTRRKSIRPHTQRLILVTFNKED